MALRTYLSLCDVKARKKPPRCALERSEIVSALLYQKNGNFDGTQNGANRLVRLLGYPQPVGWIACESVEPHRDEDRNRIVPQGCT